MVDEDSPTEDSANRTTATDGTPAERSTGGPEVDGPADGAVDGTVDGTAIDGPVDGTAIDGPVDAAAVDSPVDGMTDGTAVDSPADGAVDGTTDGTVDDRSTVGTASDGALVDDEVGSDEVAPQDPADGTGDGATADGSEDEVHDVLPDDLDVSGFVGPYVFPNNNRRRVPGYLYIGLALVCVALWFATKDDAPVLVNDGMLWAALALGLIGAYHQVAGWNLDVDEQDALVEATRTVGFAVGHASAQLGWRGLLSRPTWRILLYSAENPPQKRGLVLVDGVDGEVIDHFVEDNPEDWSDLDGSLTAP